MRTKKTWLTSRSLLAAFLAVVALLALSQVALAITPVAVTGVTVTPESAVISAGGTQQLTAAVIPDNADDQTVAWTSSNESVATVDTAGQVTGVTAGAATITATTNDGGFADACALTVDPADTALTVVHDGSTVKTYTMAQLRALTAFSGYAGYKSSSVVGPDAVTGVKLTDVLSDALGHTLRRSETVTVGQGTSFTKTFSYDRLVNFTGFTMYNATSSLAVDISSLTGPLAPVLVYGDPQARVMPAAKGPLRFFIADAAASDDVVMSPANESVSNVDTMTVTDLPALEVRYNGAVRKSYTVTQLQALTKWAGYAGFWKGGATGPDAVTGVTVKDVVQDALGTPLTASENVQVNASDGFTKTFSYDRLTNFTGFSIYSVASGQPVAVSSLTGPLAAVLVYDDPAGTVMPAAAGPLRFAVGDAAAGNADNVVMFPANESVQMVAVLDVQPIPAAGVAVAPTSLTLDAGDTSRLTATVVPSDAADQNVTWSSTNDTVASVDAAGLVTAKAPGTVIVEAKTTDGSFTSDCAVTVTAPDAGIRTTLPARGAQWRAGTTQAVRFSVQGSLASGEFGIILVQSGRSTVLGTLSGGSQSSYAYRWSVAGTRGAAAIQVGWRPIAGSGAWAVTSHSVSFTILKKLAISVTAPGADAFWRRGSKQSVKWALQKPLAGGRFTVSLRDAAGRVRLTKTVGAKNSASAYSTGLRIGSAIKTGAYTIRVQWSKGDRSLSATSPKFRVTAK